MLYGCFGPNREINRCTSISLFWNLMNFYAAFQPPILLSSSLHGQPAQLCFFFWQLVILINSKPKENWSLASSPILELRQPFLWLYCWEGESFWQSIRCYWEQPWGTGWEVGEHNREPIENLRNISVNIWEQTENRTGTQEWKNFILTKMNPLACLFSCLIV
jgi:hypothetical protein